VAEIPFQLKLKLMYQAAKGMHFLHSSGVAHRDLKSLNLLLDNKWNVKVADFGLTVFKDSMRRKGDDRRDSRNGEGAMVGSVPWMAPELLQEMPDADPVLADVYAYGIIMWEVFTRKKPFDGLTAPQVAVAVIRNDLRPTLPSASQMTEAERQYVELLSSCWHRDMTVRPVFLDVMNDIVKIGNAGGSGTSGIFSSSTYGSSSSAGSSQADRQQFSSGGRSGNSASKSSAGSSKSDYASGEVAPAAKGGEGVPRRDVSFVVCDLARFDDVWSRDPAGADKAIGQFGKMVRLRCAVHGGHIFSLPSFHSGGTFMIAFSKPAKAALFALELQYEVSALASAGAGGHASLLRDHARVSVSFRAGLTMAPADDRTRTTYEAKDYEDVLWLNTCCPPSAVVCSAAFRDSYSRARTLGVSENVGFVERRDGSVLMMREGEEPVDAADNEDDSDSDAEEHYDERDHSNVTRRDREAGVCSSNMCPWIINTDRIEMGERIGEGNYGQVLEGVYHGRKVAIKRLFNSRLDDEGMRKMRKEAAILSGIDHPRVVKLMGLSVADGKLLLVMELVPRGSLRALLSNSSVSLKWQKRLAMLRDAAVGIAFLHSKGIVHRDIKSSNLLVDDNLSVKVGDFGFATAKHDNGTMTRCGTPSWTAPEVLAPSSLATAQGSSSEHSDSDVEMKTKTKTKAKTGAVSEKADVYSFGIVMWEVLTRRMPYEDGNMMTVAMDVLQGKRPKVPNDCPSKFAEIMQRCWHQKPHKRPAMDDVLMYLNGELKDFAPL
jgi:serine/threonine protein kinase